MRKSQLHVLDLNLCEFIHWNIHRHLGNASLHDAMRRNMRNTALWGFVKRPYRDQVQQGEGSSAPGSSAISWEDLPFLLNPVELTELSAAVEHHFRYVIVEHAIPPSTTEKPGSKAPPCSKHPGLRLPRYWKHYERHGDLVSNSVVEIRNRMSSAAADEWHGNCDSFDEQLRKRNLLVSDGIGIVVEWLDELRRLKKSLGDTQRLPRPEGSFPTPTHPEPGDEIDPNTVSQDQVRSTGVSADVQRGIICVDGQEHRADAHHCQIVKSLVDAGGLYVTGPEMQGLKGCRGKKISREIAKLERQISAIQTYLRHDGNKGYRIVQK